LFPLSITAKAPATPFGYHRSIAVPGVSHVVTAVPFQLAISGFSFVWACLVGSTRNKHHIFSNLALVHRYEPCTLQSNFVFCDTPRFPLNSHRCNAGLNWWWSSFHIISDIIFES